MAYGSVVGVVLVLWEPFSGTRMEHAVRRARVRENVSWGKDNNVAHTDCKPEVMPEPATGMI